MTSATAISGTRTFSLRGAGVPPGGTMMVQGYGQTNPNGPSTYTFPVVGGTGIYANVRGSVRVRDLGDGNQSKTNLEFHLLP